MGRLVFAPEIRRFLERYPKITIELGCADRAVDLVLEGVDCALRGGPLPDSRRSARRVGDLRFLICAATRYVEQHGLPKTPEDLAAHHQIGYVLASTGKVRPVTFVRDGRISEFGVPARFVTPDSAAGLSAGLDGLGLIVLAECVASHHPASGALVRVLPGWNCPSATAPGHANHTQARSAGAGVHGLGARTVAAAVGDAVGRQMTGTLTPACRMDWPTTRPDERPDSRLGHAAAGGRVRDVAKGRSENMWPERSAAGNARDLLHALHSYRYEASRQPVTARLCMLHMWGSPWG